MNLKWAMERFVKFALGFGLEASGNTNSISVVHVSSWGASHIPFSRSWWSSNFRNFELLFLKDGGLVPHKLAAFWQNAQILT